MKTDCQRFQTAQRRWTHEVVFPCKCLEVLTDGTFCKKLYNFVRDILMRKNAPKKLASSRTANANSRNTPDACVLKVISRVSRTVKLDLLNPALPMFAY